MIEHVTHYAGLSPEGFREFRCLVCGYAVVIDTEDQIFVIINRGNTAVQHTGAGPGIAFGIQAVDRLEPFRKWAEGRL